MWFRVNAVPIGRPEKAVNVAHTGACQLAGVRPRAAAG